MPVSYKYALVLVFAFALMPVIQTTLTLGRPSGEDWNRHSLMIEDYMSGDLDKIVDRFIGYSPTFHFLMMPFYAITGFDYIQYVQPIFAFLCVLVFLILAENFTTRTGVIISGMFLVTSVAFNQFSGALLPQTIDYIVFPMVVGLLLKKRYTSCAIMTFFALTMHISGIFFIAPIWIYSLIADRKYIPYLFVACVVGTIVLAPSMWYALDIVNITNLDGNFNVVDTPIGFMPSTTQAWLTEWDYFFAYPWYNFLLFGGGLLFVTLPLTIYSMKKYPHYNKYHLLLALWFLGTLPLIRFNWWRWWSFAVLPASLFCGDMIANYIQNSSDSGILIEETQNS